MSTNIMVKRIGLWIVTAACMVAFTGCDSSVGPEDGTTKSVEGYATDDDGYGKRSGRIEGATVTAANVAADGSTSSLSASTTTNASGAYQIELREPSPVVRIRAEKDGYQSSTLVYLEGEESSTIAAQPMNAETDAEAEVYVEARSDGGDQVTLADVALYVNQEVSGQIEAGATTASEVATAVHASISSETAYIEESDETGEEEADARTELKTEAYGELQSDLAAAGSDGQASIVGSFRAEVRDAYLSANIPVETYAKARQTGHAMISLETQDVESSSDGLFHLRQQSEVVTGAAVAHAIEASFEAHGASQSRLDALADARTQLMSDLRAATSVEAMAQAKADYESSVEGELEGEIDVSSTAIADAEEALSDALATLQAALTLNISAGANAQAHSSYYSTAESTAAASLEASSNAQLGGEVLALLSNQ